MTVNEKRRARKICAAESETKKPIQNSQQESFYTRVFSPQKNRAMPHNSVRLFLF